MAIIEAQKASDGPHAILLKMSWAQAIEASNTNLGQSTLGLGSCCKPQGADPRMEGLMGPFPGASLGVHLGGDLRRPKFEFELVEGEGGNPGR